MLRTTTRTTMVLAALVIALASIASLPAHAQARKDDRSQRNEKDKKPAAEGLTAPQRQEAAPLAKLADEVMKGTAAGTYLVTPPKDPAKSDGKEAAATQPAPSEIALTWRNDFLKAQQGQIFVPFTVQLDAGRMGTSVAAYLRIAPKGATGLPAPAAGEKAPAYPFEDVYFTELRGAGAGQPLKLTRAFAVAPGTYDVYVAIRERPSSTTVADAPVKVVLLKQELVVPNYHTEELQTSSVLVADKIEQLTAPVAPEAMKERPYVLGDSEISPAADMKFKKTEELQLVFQIYGAKVGADTKKPDVTVDYIFYQKDASGEKLFNRTPSQTLSDKTLPPNFDPDAGHQLMTGQGVPLASFPEGDFRLEIKITDNKTQKSLTRDVLFTVVAAS
jgi:hypothetical protein